MNGGTCIDGVDNFTCSCPPRLTGSLCECLILEDGTQDCEYVSPTPLPESTQSVLLTSIQEELTTIETTTISLISYNHTSDRTAIMTLETEPTTVIKISEKTTTSELTTETVTKEGTSTKYDETGDTTALVLIDTTKNAVTETPEMRTAVTIDSENAKTDVTTECQENCGVTTTPKLPLPETTSMDTTKQDTTVIFTSEITELTTLPITEVSLITVESTTKEIAEVATTSKSETTTDKIFTHTPTEHYVTDVPLPTTHSTTEVMEVTTSFDNTTYLSTTILPECTDSVCNNHGNCINTPHGIRVC